MTDLPIGFGDPLSRPFWQAASRRELVVQRCMTCGSASLHPHPYCMRCQSDDLAWIRAAGTATVISQTTVHVRPVAGLDPPYVCALVQLDEGPRLLTNLVGPPCRIGDRVGVAWRHRAGDRPPVPIFTPLLPEEPA